MPIKDPVARRENHREYMRRRYQTDPQHRAKQLVRVKTKYATKEACSKCGAPQAEAHHPDYKQPDLRVWLCRGCHLNEHNVVSLGDAPIS